MTFCSSGFGGVQPSQNVPAAGTLAAFNEISAAYFTLVFRTRLSPDPPTMQIFCPLLLPITIASLPTTQKHFDWAGVIGNIRKFLFLFFSNDYNKKNLL